MSLLHWVDRFQQKHTTLAFIVAVIKKYGDDRGNDQAAILTYYGFLALFPLLLAMLSLLEIGLATHPAFRQTIEQSAFSNFPILSGTLGRNIEVQSGTWLRVGASTLVAILAGLGIANSLQRIAADFWHVPDKKRRSFPQNVIASLGMLGAGTAILVLTTIVAQWLLGSSGMWHFIVTIPMNFALFFMLFRFATPPTIVAKKLLAQTILTTVGWQILQSLGSYLVRHQLSHLSPLYGSFAAVLGLLFWLYLLARMVLYAIETDVVLAKKLWPRVLFPYPKSAMRSHGKSARPKWP